jgi:hypothetical protein
MRINNLIIISALALLLFSCKKDNPTPEDLGYGYYPINDGDYSLYDVVDTSFQGVGAHVVTKYQIREEIHEPVTINEETRYQLYVYYKPEGEEWKDYPDSVWTVFNTNGKIIKVQNNVRFVKLVFPFEVGKKWDGNISDPTSDPQDYYEMKEVRRPFSYDSFTYDKTVSVVEFDNNSALDDNYSVEVFANETGLVYKEVKIYKYDQSNLAAKEIEFGQHYFQKLQGHGKYK